MKCEFCNGNMSLEDLHCPHCGQINKHAQQHIRDMQRYQGEFNETKEDVITVTQKYSLVKVAKSLYTHNLMPTQALGEAVL